MRCLERTNHYMSQLLTPKRKKKENPATVATISLNEGQPKTVTLGLSLIRSNIVTRLLLRMIILHGFPLPMVDHVAFKVFSRNLQPYELVAYRTIKETCMKIYIKEKKRVSHALSNL